MIDDTEARLNEAQTELAQARAELDKMRADTERRNISDQLAREFRSKGLPDQAADENAATLAGQVERAGGELVCGQRLGVENIVSEHLRERPWLARAGRPKGDKAPAPAVAEKFDAARAEHDPDYDKEWAKKDPKAHKEGWDALIRARADQQLKGAAS